MYQQHIASPLTKPVFAPVTSVEPVEGDPLSFKFVLDQSWYTFPVTLAAQTGYVASRATIEEEGGGLKPVGTGPFELKSYEPDSAFVATKYDGYWQEGLPHLDEIEYRPIADVNSRQAAFDAGDVQIFTTDNFEVKNDYSEKCAAGDCQIIIDPGESEEVLVILNTAIRAVRQRERPQGARLRHRQAGDHRHGGSRCRTGQRPVGAELPVVRPGGRGDLPPVRPREGPRGRRRVRGGDRRDAVVRVRLDSEPVGAGGRRPPGSAVGRGRDRDRREDRRTDGVHPRRRSTAASRPTSGASSARRSPTATTSGGSPTTRPNPAPSGSTWPATRIPRSTRPSRRPG